MRRAERTSPNMRQATNLAGTKSSVFGTGAEHYRAAFDRGALSLTVGAEEELMLVDARSGRLLPSIDEVLGRMDGDDRFRAEFRAAQVELVTRPCLSAADVGRELGVARVELAEEIADGGRLVACGAHPTALRLGPITGGERYRDIGVDNPWAATHMLTCGLHVHVALADGDRALAVYNALRSYLPEFAALAANSPYHRAADSGTASTRLLLNRSLARHGVPPAFRDWNAYAELAAWGQVGGSIPDPSYHWWDLRLHPGYGTLEIRVCDTQTDLQDAVALIGLAQTLVARLAARYDAGERLAVHDTYRISESVWFGARSGALGTVLDLDSGEQQSVDRRLAGLLEELAPLAAELGTERELARVSLLARAGGAERQRRLVRERGLHELVDWLASQTLASARRYLVRAGVAVAQDAPVARTTSSV
jgi:carboxylate-amine ligase